MHPRLGSTTLLQLAFPREDNPDFLLDKFHWDDTVVESIKKRKKEMNPVSGSCFYLMSPASCTVPPVLFLLYPVMYLLYPVSRSLPYLIFPASLTLYPVLFLLYPVFCLMYPVSRS